MNTDYYRGKIIIGDAGKQSCAVIFATNCGGGYTEQYAKTHDELVDIVHELLNGEHYTPEDLQNGPTQKDAEKCSHYLSCFPPLAEEKFDYLKHRLKQQK